MFLEQELNQLISSVSNKYNIDNAVKQDGIVLYGAGAMGEMALDFLELINVAPKYIIDTQKNGKLRGIKIIHPTDIPKNDLESLTFILCIVTVPITPIVNYLKELGCQDIRHFYDYTEIMLKNELTNGWSCLNPTSEDIEAITKVCAYLEHDKYSLAHYLQFLWWRLRRVEKTYLEYPILSNQKYFKAPCMPKLRENESFLDGGAHFGTTTKSFLDTVDMKFETIWAVEPDEKNLATMKAGFSDIDNIRYLPIALSDTNETVNFVNDFGFASKVKKNGNKTIKTQTIDSLNINPSIIKLHLEGYELKALEGVKETINRVRPILMVLADHNEDGLYKIADFMMGLEEYKIHFYLHDYCGNSAIFYAIPNERFSNEG
jgi:FkbM family methyltransferase